jgi:hypothetical protein
MNKFCTACGNVIAGEAFCRQCGTRVGIGTLNPVASAESFTLPLPGVQASFQDPRDSAVENPESIRYPLGQQSPILGRQPLVQVQVINAVPPISHVQTTAEAKGTYGLPVPSMIIGIVFTFGLIFETNWDSDAWNGATAFCITGLTMGIVSLCRQKKGKRMAIAGIVLCSIGLIGAIGHLP